MAGRANPYAVPSKLPPALDKVRRYWSALRRRQAEMPFGDDLHLSKLPQAHDRAIVIEVLPQPPRFRLAIVGHQINRQFGNELSGRMLDELEMAPPLDFLASQAHAVLESRRPAYYRGASYSRLLLPMWGDGRISMILGAVARTARR